MIQGNLVDFRLCCFFRILAAMANEIVLINGVTKKERNGIFTYKFGNTIIDARLDNATLVYYDVDGTQNHIVAFADITDKLGATDVEEYADILAAGDYYQTVINGEVAATIDKTGLATEAKQDTGNASLSSIDGKVAVEAKQDTQITLLTTIASNTGGAAGDPLGISEALALRNVRFQSSATRYVAFAVKLKAGQEATVFNSIVFPILSVNKDAFEWSIELDPVTAGTLTYVSAGTNTEIATGDNSQTVTTQGTILASSVGYYQKTVDAKLKTAAINTSILVLSIKPTTSGADFYAYFNREEQI